jgi:hypothetical protein
VIKQASKKEEIERKKGKNEKGKEEYVNMRMARKVKQ